MSWSVFQKVSGFLIEPLAVGNARWLYLVFMAKAEEASECRYRLG